MEPTYPPKSDLSARIAALEAEQARLQARCQQLQQDHKRLQSRYQNLSAQMSATQAQLQQAEESLRQQFEQFSALRAMDALVTANLGLMPLLRFFVEQVAFLLHVDAAAVLLCDPQARTLTFAVGHGFRTQGITHSCVSLGEGRAGQAAQEHCLDFVPDLRAASTTFTRAGLIAGEDFVAYFVIPLLAKNQVKGVLEIFHRGELEPSREWLETLEMLAGHMAIAMDNAMLFQELQQANAELVGAYDATIEGWARALELRDKETEGHSRRVTEMTMRLARKLGMSAAELTHVRRGAILHDIGKMGIPDAILLKPGPLTEEERKVMCQHPVYAHEWLWPIQFLRPALAIPYSHHEKWDGTGYPQGLQGPQIPLEARIFAIVDVWDALNSDRPYRPRWDQDRIYRHIQSLAGTHFDPELVEVFLSVMAEGESQEQANELREAA